MFINFPTGEQGCDCQGCWEEKARDREEQGEEQEHGDDCPLHPHIVTIIIFLWRWLSPPSSHCDHYHVLSPWPRLSYPSLCGTCLLCSVTSYPIHLIQNTKNALYFANYDSVWLLINCYNTDLHTSWHRRRHKLKLLIKLIIYIYIKHLAVTIRNIFWKEKSMICQPMRFNLDEFQIVKGTRNHQTSTSTATNWSIKIQHWLHLDYFSSLQPWRFQYHHLCQLSGDLRPGKQRRCQWRFSSITALACNAIISVIPNITISIITIAIIISSTVEVPLTGNTVFSVAFMFCVNVAAFIFSTGKLIEEEFGSARSGAQRVELDLSAKTVR